MAMVTRLTIGGGILLKLDHCGHSAIIAPALTHLRGATGKEGHL